MTSTEFVSTLQNYFHRETPTPYFLATIRDYVENRTPGHRQTLLKLVITGCKFMPTIFDLVQLEKQIQPNTTLMIEEPLPTLQECAEIRRMYKEWKSHFPADGVQRNLKLVKRERTA